MYRRFMKRIFDFLLSFILLILFSWAYLLIILLVKATSPGPIFFLQKRIGIDKQEFYIIKFRTMRIDTPKDTPTHLLLDPDQYITSLGKFLRMTSLDELPQLLNIIKGDMSIVGPRPALWNQYDLIEERDKYGANNIRPGLTGWAQVNGRDELPILVKAEFDGEYVKRMCFTFDMRCIFKTVICVIMRDGMKEGTSKANNKSKIDITGLDG